MWLNDDALIIKRDLVFDRPFVNNSGILGFHPDPSVMPFLSHLGAFITNPISRFPRKPAKNRACIPFNGGLLLHTGLQNPGISQAIRKFKQAWASSALPIIVHLLVEIPGTLEEMVRKLEGCENIMGIELGLPPDCTPQDLPDFLHAAQGELPVIVCMEPGQVSTYLEALVQTQPAALHLAEPRGTLPGTLGENITGRLYGPALFPQTLYTVMQVVEAGIPLIAGGGVTSQADIKALLDAGVAAVGLGSVLWQIDGESIFRVKTTNIV
jgi:dihydroorotate dehydrogenase (NAD+) catalytic subunit